MNLGKLVYMANQVSKFFAVHGEQKAAHEVEKHLARFWEPRMREAIIEYCRKDGRDLHPIARKAVARLAGEEAKE